MQDYSRVIDFFHSNQQEQLWFNLWFASFWQRWVCGTVVLTACTRAVHCRVRSLWPLYWDSVSVCTDDLEFRLASILGFLGAQNLDPFQELFLLWRNFDFNSG